MTSEQVIQELRDGLHNTRLSSPGCEVNTLSAAVERVIAALSREVEGRGHWAPSTATVYVAGVPEELFDPNVQPDEIDEDPAVGSLNQGL